MVITIEELTRAGLVEKAGELMRLDNKRLLQIKSTLEKEIKPNATTHLRSAGEKARQADLRAHDTGAAAVLERHTRDGAVGQVSLQKRFSGQVCIRVTAIRTRLLDEDNLAAKFHIDILRYASGGALGDSPATTRIEIRQQKAQAGEREEVRLEVFEL